MRVTLSKEAINALIIMYLDFENKRSIKVMEVKDNGMMVDLRKKAESGDFYDKYLE